MLKVEQKFPGISLLLRAHYDAMSSVLLVLLGLFGGALCAAVLLGLMQGEMPGFLP